jgi:hypothetical protein
MSRMTLRRLLTAVVCAMTAAMTSAPPAGAAEATTTIRLDVVGCDGCRVQAVQNVDGTLPYQSESRVVRRGHVSFTVPTSSTQRMAFLVYAPFDEEARAGVPMVVVLGYRGKDPGEKISMRFALGSHVSSGCWAGTSDAVVDNRLVVTRQRTRSSLLGPGTYTIAAGHFARTVETRPFFDRRAASAYHVSDPSICR